MHHYTKRILIWQLFQNLNCFIEWLMDIKRRPQRERKMNRKDSHHLEWMAARKPITRVSFPGQSYFTEGHAILERNWVCLAQKKKKKCKKKQSGRMIILKQSLLGDEACSNSRWIWNVPVVSDPALDIIISSRMARVLYTNKS